MSDYEIETQLWTVEREVFTNKVNAVSSWILYNKLDIYVITETWTKTDADHQNRRISFETETTAKR